MNELTAERFLAAWADMLERDDAALTVYVLASGSVYVEATETGVPVSDWRLS